MAERLEVISGFIMVMAHHKPSKVAQLGRRIFGVDVRDDRSAAIETVASLRAAKRSVTSTRVVIEK